MVHAWRHITNLSTVPVVHAHERVITPIADKSQVRTIRGPSQPADSTTKTRQPSGLGPFRQWQLHEVPAATEGDPVTSGRERKATSLHDLGRHPSRERDHPNRSPFLVGREERVRDLALAIRCASSDEKQPVGIGHEDERSEFLAVVASIVGQLPAFPRGAFGDPDVALTFSIFEPRDAIGGLRGHQARRKRIGHYVADGERSLRCRRRTSQEEHASDETNGLHKTIQHK